MANSTISLSFKIEDKGNGLKSLTFDANALQKAMQANVVDAQSLHKGFLNLAGLVTDLKGLQGTFNSINGALNSLTEESRSFGKAMREANTMAGKNAYGFDAMKEQVADLAKEVPLLRDKLANGLYQTISNGVPEPQWMEYLAASSRAAVGGLADIGSVVGVTATVINNYGAMRVS